MASSCDFTTIRRCCTLGIVGYVVGFPLGIITTSLVSLVAVNVLSGITPMIGGMIAGTVSAIHLGSIPTLRNYPFTKFSIMVLSFVAAPVTISLLTGASITLSSSIIFTLSMFLVAKVMQLAIKTFPPEVEFKLGKCLQALLA